MIIFNLGSGGMIIFYLRSGGMPYRLIPSHFEHCVLDYDRTNCYISYLSMFVFLPCIYKRRCCAIELSRTRYAVFWFIRMCSDILFIEIVCATRIDMIVQVSRTGTIIQE